MRESSLISSIIDALQECLEVLLVVKIVTCHHCSGRVGEEKVQGVDVVVLHQSFLLRQSKQEAHAPVHFVVLAEGLGSAKHMLRRVQCQ